MLNFRDVHSVEVLKIATFFLVVYVESPLFTHGHCARKFGQQESSSKSRKNARGTHKIP